MHGRVGAIALDEAEQRSGLAVDDGERLGVSGAERDASGGVVAALPDVAGRCVLELGELGARRSASPPSVFGVSLVQRRLVCRGEHVRIEDARVGVVEDRRLDAAREERVGLAREELVERVVARDEDRESAVAPTGASPLLAERRDRSGEPDGDRAVEKADVDARARVRRSPSRRAAPPRPVAARCRGAARACSRRGTERVALAVAMSTRSAAKRWISSAARRLFAKQIVRRPRDVSCDRRRAASPSALARSPSSASRSGRVPDHDLALGPGRRVQIDHRRGLPRELECELARRWRSSPLPAGTAARPGRSARAAEAAGGRWRRASRRRPR